MKVGDMVGGYLISQPFTNEGGGQSEWTFAERDGNSFFFKRFLTPTYPLEDGPGSARTKQLKRERCAAFETHQQTITAMLKPLSTTGGNLVVTRTFFRYGAHYCKVTDRVDTSTLPLRTIAALPLRDQLSLMLGVTHSLAILHRHELVHGDIKPDNILLKRVGAERYATKLIDFDNCFRVGDPPAQGDMVGDPAYYSPELMAHVKGTADVSAVSQASDVFALGVVFTEYLTTEKPVCGFPGLLSEGLLNGARLLPPPLPAGAEGVGELILSMLDADPANRPDAERLGAELKRLRKNGGRAAESGGDGGPGPSPVEGRLIGRLAHALPEPDESTDDPAEPSGTRRGKALISRSAETEDMPALRGKLFELHRKKKLTD